MFAVIKTGGKQYRAEEGMVLEIEKLDIKQGQAVTFDEVLLVDDDDKTLIGDPFVKDAVVTGKVLEHFKDKKVLVFKKKRRKQYKRTYGHRQELTKVQIEKILLGQAKPAAKPAAPKAKAEAAPEKPKAKAAPKPAAKKAAKPAAKPAPKTKAEAAPKPKAAPKAKAEAPPKPKPKAAAKPKAKAASKPAAKKAAKPAAKSAATPKPAAKPKPKAKAAAKPAAKKATSVKE